jgi:hypothetical protein
VHEDSREAEMIPIKINREIFFIKNLLAGINVGSQRKDR